MGRNHHTNFFEYAYSRDYEYFLNRAYFFIEDAENSVVKYARIRVGLCYWLQRMYCSLQDKHTPLEIKKLKHLKGELSSTINKLDSYMQTMVNYSYLM